MKKDVLDALSGRFPATIPCKETLNYPGLVNRVSGIDVFKDSSRAFALAWERLGIDIQAEVSTQAEPPAVKFDWDGFMTAAALDPDRFDRCFWQPRTEIRRTHVEALCGMDEERIPAALWEPRRVAPSPDFSHSGGFSRVGAL
jgi:hypothetical protein